jgi:predicted DNA-binding transcriptional regulator YafY
MRADRLLAMLLLLQTRGKLTAQTLAEELEVSRRTILRDVDALSAAGVPIYAEGGHGGGIALDEQYRTQLTGLHTPEVQALFVADNSLVLRDVGLKDAAQQLTLKLLAALPVAHRLTVDHVRQRLLIDSTWWWRDAEMPPFWDNLQQAVYEDRMVEGVYERYKGDIVARTLEPYSLVNKSGYWYLIARRAGAFRIYRIARFHEVRLSEQYFARLPDFDLPQYWETHLQEFVDSFTQYHCTLRIHPDRIAFVKGLAPGRWQELATNEETGWLTLQLAMDSPLLAKMLVFGLGTWVDVIAPTELAEEVLSDARTTVRHFENKWHASSEL